MFAAKKYSRDAYLLWMRCVTSLLNLFCKTAYTRTEACIVMTHFFFPLFFAFICIQIFILFLLCNSSGREELICFFWFCETLNYFFVYTSFFLLLYTKNSHLSFIRNYSPSLILLYSSYQHMFFIASYNIFLIVPFTWKTRFSPFHQARIASASLCFMFKESFPLTVTGSLQH